MPGPYSKGAQNAEKIGDAFADIGETKVGTVATGSGDSTAVVTHSLSGTPDFIIASRTTAGGALTWSANSTSVTFTTGTATSVTVAYIMGYTA